MRWNYNAVDAAEVYSLRVRGQKHKQERHASATLGMTFLFVLEGTYFRNRSATTKSFEPAVY